jgi:hypothetical protein
MDDNNDLVGKPVFLGSNEQQPPEIEGMKFERDQSVEREQLLGAMWVLVNRLGGEQNINFDEFISAVDSGAHLQIRISGTRGEMSLLATKVKS